MSKNYAEVSTQAAVVQTKDRTLAFYPAIEMMPVEKFAELIDGRVKMGLNDFSRGKGDDAVYAYYNLDLPDVYYLLSRARQFYMPQPMYRTKIHGAYPIEAGTYQGLCRSFHLSISRQETTVNGQIKNLPWNITISNGVAQAMPGANQGSYYEKGGTYQELCSVYINLSNEDFLHCFEKVNSYIKNYESLAARTLIPKGLQLLKSVEERGSYQQNALPPVTQENAQTVNQNTNNMPQAPQSSYPSPQMPATQPMKTQTPTFHRATIIINSDFFAVENGLSFAECIANGNKFYIYFDAITNELMNSKTAQTPVNVNLYQDEQKRFRCAGVAA